MTTQLIDHTKLRAEIISDGEDDYTGLYEIIWSLNSAYPDLPRAPKVAAARAVTAELLNEGRLRFYKTIWASNDFEPVSAAVARAAVSSDEAWDDPTEDPYFCYAAT